MPSLVILSESLFGKIVTDFDSAVYALVFTYLSEELTRIMRFITFLGSDWGLSIISLIILFAAYISKERKYLLRSLMVLVNLAAGASLNYILKQLFHRPRPDLHRLIEIGGYSFPSGHSMSSMIFYGFLIYLIVRYIKHWFKYTIAGVLCLLVLAIGISRIFLGVHYASDVLGAYIFGLGWLIIYIRFSDKLIHFVKRILKYE